MTNKLGSLQQQKDEVSTKTRSIVQKFESSRPQPQINRSNSFIDSRVKQLEAELQTEKKLLAEKEAEIQNLQSQIEEFDEIEDRLIEDKTKALTALNEAVQKLESKHDALKKLQSVEDELSKELQRAYDQIAELEDRTRDVESKVSKKDESISYWRNLYEQRTMPLDTDSQSGTSEIVDRFQC